MDIVIQSNRAASPVSSLREVWRRGEVSPPLASTESPRSPAGSPELHRSGASFSCLPDFGLFPPSPAALSLCGRPSSR